MHSAPRCGRLYTRNERTIDSLASHLHSNERRKFVYTEIPTHTQIAGTDDLFTYKTIKLDQHTNKNLFECK